MATARRIEDASIEPLTVDQAAAWTGSSRSTEDLAQLEPLVRECRQLLEDHLKIALMSQRWELVLDQAEAGTVLELPRPPLLAAESLVSISGSTGEETAVDPTTYRVVYGRPGRVILLDGHSWPSDMARVAGLRVVFEAGHGSDAGMVPGPLVLATRELVQYYLRHRGTGVVQNTQQGGHIVVPPEVQRILARVRDYAWWGL